MTRAEPFLADPDVTLYQGEVGAVLAGLPDASVHCVVTSPPYWGLRDYGTGDWTGGDPGCPHNQGRAGAGRADGDVDVRAQRNRDGAAALTRNVCRCGARRVDSQLGLEATPELYVARLVAIFREVRRVLRPDGVCWLNLGDSYAANRTYQVHNTKGAGEHTYSRGASVPAGLKPKDLVGIPWMVAFALRADGWYLRAENIWQKPNPMPSSVTDRTTRSHEQVFMLTRSARYFYDGFAVQEDAAVDGDDEAIGRNRRSVWTIATEPNELAACEDCDAIFDKTAAARRHEAQTGHRTAGHFAAFPRELVRVCVAAGTSEHGCCSACGTPYRRVVEEGEPVLPANTWSGNGGAQYTDNAGVMEARSTLKQLIPRETVGWQPGCSCAAPVEPATVLDPFMGSGTTALVARAMGCRAVGVELRPAYCRMTTARLQQQSLFA